jgi:hypothetical protein
MVTGIWPEHPRQPRPRLSDASDGATRLPARRQRAGHGVWNPGYLPSGSNPAPAIRLAASSSVSRATSVVIGTPPAGVDQLANVCSRTRVVTRIQCVDCGGYLTGRAERRSRPGVPTWGSWCPRCCGWWPDVDGAQADVDQPARWRLIDDPLTITPVATPW